jgi:hypothetical protein
MFPESEVETQAEQHDREIRRAVLAAPTLCERIRQIVEALSPALE